LVEPGPHLSPDDPALTSVTESLPPVEAQYIVPAPTTDPTVANPVTHAVAVTEVDEEVVETDPDRSTGIVVAIVLLIVGLLVGVVIWLATRSDEPAKPYPCSGTGATIADWNASGVRFDNGAVAPWPRGADAGTKSALDQTCAQLGALETANAAATSTTLPSSPAASSAPTTARPSSASTALRPPITAAPAVPPTTHAQAATVPTGTPATLGNGLTLVVTGFAPDASATVQSAGGGAPPTPPSGSRYSVVSATVTNPTAARSIRAHSTFVSSTRQRARPTRYRRVSPPAARSTWRGNSTPVKPEPATSSSWFRRLPAGTSSFEQQPMARAPCSHSRDETKQRRTLVITLGVILLIIGFVAQVPILWSIGIVLLVVGAVLYLLGTAGHEIGGRRHYY